MPRHRASRAADVTRDLDLIEAHLVRACQDFGEDTGNAIERAGARVDEALACMRTFVTHPHRGAEHPAIRPGIRAVTHKNLVMYFEIDEATSEVWTLAASPGCIDLTQRPGRLFPSPHPDAAAFCLERHAEFLGGVLTRIAKGSATMTIVSSAYGCDLVAVCRDIKLTMLGG